MKSRRIVIGLVVAAVSAVAYLVPGAADAAVQPRLSSGFVHLHEQEQKKCLDVRQEDGASKDGARLQRFTCHDVDEQRWLPELIGTVTVGVDRYDVYHLISRKSGMCADIQDESTAAGAQAVQWTCDPDRGNQNFMSFHDTETVLTQIHPQLSGLGMCLDTFGQFVVQFFCNGGSAQFWKFQ